MFRFLYLLLLFLFSKVCGSLSLSCRAGRRQLLRRLCSAQRAEYNLPWVSCFAIHLPLLKQYGRGMPQLFLGSGATSYPTGGITIKIAPFPKIFIYFGVAGEGGGKVFIILAIRMLHGVVRPLKQTLMHVPNVRYGSRSRDVHCFQDISAEQINR